MKAIIQICIFRNHLALTYCNTTSSTDFPIMKWISPTYEVIFESSYPVHFRIQSENQSPFTYKGPYSNYVDGILVYYFTLLPHVAQDPTSL